MSHTTLRPAERVLLEMADVPSAQRLRWLARRCATEPALLAEVQALVDQFEAPDEPTGVPARALHAPLTGHAGLLVPGTEIDDFTILGLLGAGASGVAYIARQELLGREVALKVLRTSSSASAQKRFELEAEVLARLDHPGIARVYASRGPRSDCPAYIAMELVEGEAITDYVAAQTLPVPACLELVARVCDAVHHAHQRGVIHRDLKPGNILVTSDGHPKVLDFGVARLVHAAAGGSDHETQIGQMVGTLPYMSPEQLAGDPGDLDIRTDVYALGVLLYHLLSGVLPFDFAEMSLGDAARAICQRDPLRLEVRRPGLPPDVCIVIACAMARIRERRYDSAAELAADLRRAATGVPIAAHRDSALLTLLHRLRRSRLVATAAAAGLIGVAGLAGYAIVQRTEARAAADALAAELARSTVERGRLLGRMGNLPVAEQMLWQRTLADPEAGASRWALRELYARYTSMWETQAHAQEVTVVRFSADDRLAISGGRDGRVQVLRARDGEPQRHWTDHGAARVIDAGFLAAGRAYSIDEQGMVVVHDVAADAPVHVWKLPDLEVRNASLLSADRLLLAAVRGAAAAPQGELVAVSLADGTARTIWTAPPGLPVDCVAPSPEGDAVVVGDARGGLTVVELTSGRVRWQSAGHEAPVARVAWSPDGRWLASGSSDRTVRLWDARSGRLSRALTAGNGTARSVAFSADSRQIVSAGWWRVEIWDVETGLLVRDDIGASQGWYDARFNSAGDRLLVGSAQGGIRLWDLSAPLVLHPPSPAAPPSVSFDTDRAALHAVIGRTDGRLDVLHAGGQPLTARHGDLLAQVAVDAAGRMFASAGANPMLRVWRHDSNGAVPLLTLPDGDALAVAMSADGRLVAVGEVGGRLTVVRTDDGQTLYTVPGGDGDLLAVRFDATGAELFTGYRDRRIVVRDSADGRVVREMQSTSAPFVFAYHAPTGRLAAGTWAGAIDVWSAATGERLASLTGHARLVTDLDFLAADVLLSTGRDGTVRAWSLSQPSELALLRQRSVGGEGVRVVDDGQRLALMFEDGHAELFDLTALDARIAGHRNAQRTPRPEPR